LSLSCLVMRRARPAWYKPAYRIPLYPWLPTVGGTLCLLVITTMERAPQAAGLVLVLFGVVWRYAWAWDRTKVEGVLGPLLQRERIRAHATEMSLTRGREILVLVANPYYFNVVGLMFFLPPRDKTPIYVPHLLRVALVLTLAMTLVIGVYPQPFIGLAQGAAT